MKKNRAWLASVILLLAGTATSLAYAANTDRTSLIDQVRVDKDGRGLIYFPTSVTTGASCRDPGLRNVIAFDTKTEGGRAILQLALAAHLAAKQVHVVGTGLCSIYTIAEDADRVYLQP